MFLNTRLLLAMTVLAVLPGGCKTATPGGPAREGVSNCIIIYDAGSSRTRMFVYQQTASGWLQHPGPTTPALADPIRGNRGKTMTDVDSTIDALLGTLSDIRKDGPLDKDGKPRWPAFDWQQHCNVETAAVYGTAGMRMAEQQNAAASGMFWIRLNVRLGEALGVPVITRSLSEYEEGLYAWLALGESQPDVNFGIAEMGGASIQVAFPCLTCEGARKVRAKGRTMRIYSHSFPGWGQDEAWNRFGHAAVCKRGAGVVNQAWQIEDCEAVMTGFAAAAADVAALIKNADGLRWRLTDAFRYMHDSDIENYCRLGIDSGFQPESSCFRAVYLQEVLKSLGVPPNAEKSDANWTLGAVVCTASRCLENR